MREKDRQMREDGGEQWSLLLGGGSAAPGLRWTNWGRKRRRARGLLNWNPRCAICCLWVLNKWFYLYELVFSPWHNGMRTQMLQDGCEAKWNACGRSQERADLPLTMACLVSHGLLMPFCPGAARYWQLLPFSRERVSVQEGSAPPTPPPPAPCPLWLITQLSACLTFAGLAPGGSGHWAQLPSSWPWSGAKCVCVYVCARECVVGKCLSMCGRVNGWGSCATWL